MECTPKGEVILGKNGKPTCQTITLKLAAAGLKMKYTDQGGTAPLTLAACHPDWEDFLDLNETVSEMADHLMEEDIRSKGTPSPQDNTASKITPLPPPGSIMVPVGNFLGDQSARASRDNPVHLSDATEASVSGSRPNKGADTEDNTAILGHFSDALREMAASIISLEDRYYKALCEVIVETEKALRDVSRIDAHYVSRVVMAAWQEAVQVVASHMEGVDTTTFLAARKDARRVTHEYVQKVTQAREERDATHAEEQEQRKEAIKKNDLKDPVVCLLHVTCWVVHAQCEKVVDAFLTSIDNTLHKHVAIHAQGPLMANALSTAFQFQMSVWCMVGEECVRPIWTKHSDWCGLAGIVQAIVETFPKKCALMFPPAPAPASAQPVSFSSMFKPVPSDGDEDDDNDTLGTGGGLLKFSTSTPMLSGSRCGSAAMFSDAPSFTSGALPHAGAFLLASDNLAVPGTSAHVRGSHAGNPDLGEEVDNEDDLEKGVGKDASGEPTLDTDEMALLEDIIPWVAPQSRPPVMPKSGNKRAVTHFDGGSASSESSAEDLNATRLASRSSKKGGTPTKVSSPDQWSTSDVDTVRQLQYKADFQHFRDYRDEKISLANKKSINTVNHSAYLATAHKAPNTVIARCVFSVANYQAVLQKQGGDVAKFDQEAKYFKKGASRSRAPDTEKVPIDRVMLVCQHEDGRDVVYSDPDGFGCPGTMGLWDLHSPGALARGKMILDSGTVDANFCPLCAFWSTNNETLNNHIRKHYQMGLTCRTDGFTTSSVAVMKAHMEKEHGYKGKRAGQAKKPKGKG